MNILILIVITLILSLTINLFLKRFNISPIIGYIITGALIGSSLDLANAINQHTLHEVAEFGIVFLMFTIGLEFSLQHLKKMKKEVFIFGSLQVAITAFLFSLLAYQVFDLRAVSAIVIGFALALSSTAIVLKILNENGDIHRPYGRYSLGILLFQDLAVIPILLMISIFADTQQSIHDLVTNTITSGVIVLLILFILGKYATEKFLGYIVDAKTDELFIGAIILIVLSSALVSYLFGFSYSLGAFIAGMLIAETKYKHQIEADLVPFRDLLLGLFFITVGLQINLHYVYENFLIIIAFTTTILVLKGIIIFTIIYFFSFGKRAFKTALALAQVGEFSFAVLELAKANNIISQENNQLLISVVVLSLVFTSLAIRHIRYVSSLFMPERSEAIADPIVSAAINNHVVVCGYSLLGQKIVRQLKHKGIKYIAIEHDKNHVNTGIKNGDVVFFGNAASKVMLNSVYIKNAAAVIIAIDNATKARMICEAIKYIDSTIPIVVKISNDQQSQDLADLDVKDFVDENESVAKLLVSKAMKCDVLYSEKLA